jgi:hypothetical protein
MPDVASRHDQEPRMPTGFFTRAVQTDNSLSAYAAPEKSS